MKHEIKNLPEYFEAVACGAKKFELRKNDRCYEVGGYRDIAGMERV